jgi:hypothetical protein
MTLPLPDTPAETEARVVAASSSVDAAALTTGGQRRINLLWERTQATIAIAVVFVVLGVVASLILVPIFRGDPLAETGVTGLVLLSTLATNVTTVYFTRTNHTKTGGVGPRDETR